MHEYAADTAWQLHCISKDELLSVVSAHPVLCHERSGESQGYWWSFVMIEDEVRLLDSEIPSFEVTARWESFASALDKSNALTFFELKQMHMEEEMSMSEAYHLKGRGPADGSPTVKSAQTPLKNCALCVFFLYPKRKQVSTATVYTLRAPRQSCTSLCDAERSRAKPPTTTTSWGTKTNSPDPNQAEYILMTANTGFHVSFIPYHDALQFRGYLSNHAIAWSQKNALWEDDHAHARFHKDYALARLLVSMK